MKLTRKVLALCCAVAALVTLPTTKAMALSDDEAAILVGIAVGGLAAYSVKHHREHDRALSHNYSHSNRHIHNKRCHKGRSTRVEHYVVHNPPSRVYGNHRIKYRQSHYDSKPKARYRSHSAKHYDRHYRF